MTRRQYSNTATEATLASAIAAPDTSLTLASFAGYPAVPFTATISRGESDEEVLLITAVSGSTVTATRGYDGTTSKSHAAGATFIHTTVAKDFDEANDHVNKSTGVHGVNGLVVGTSDSQTLTNKVLIAPSLISPTTTGTATFASATFSGTLAVTGAASFGGTVDVLTPTTATHAARKDYVDAADTALGGRITGNDNTLAAATAAPTVSTLAKRDAAGRLQVVSPSATADVATKGYVDTADTALSGRITTLETDTGWTAPTLGSSWTNYGAGYQTVRWRRINNRVEIQGLVAGGVPGTLFTLPVGSRPAATLPFTVLSNSSSAARVDVQADGTVSVVSLGTGNNGYLSLNFSFLI